MFNIPEKIVRDLSYFTIGSALVFFTHTGFAQQLTYADEHSLEVSEHDLRKEKVNRQCDHDPTSPKCQKFLDSRYRRHTDVDIKAKVDPVQGMRAEKSYQEELRKELLSYCRTEPDAPRCQKIAVKK